ncbi:hypothetical protein BaRGS_00010183 [Batillaria attramentaria]|uniref:receptor protein-tyrosine kinase n=1 Tax=Batillaria attramentaria TaxID=370345 RepID=A0ABD0LH16_9CAEN
MEVLWFCVLTLVPALCSGVTFEEDFTAESTPVEEDRDVLSTGRVKVNNGELYRSYKRRLSNEIHQNYVHYHALRKRYAGCTYVHGNVEITNLDDPVLRYNLDFLSSIKYVSGYVLIGLSTQVEQIPLRNLEVIRGNHTYRVQGEEYALVVALTSRDSTPVMGLRNLYMPKLKEISRGKVMFSQNPLLSHMSTVAWDIITRGRPDSIHLAEKAFEMKEETCADECNIDGNGLCWGDSPDMCQEAICAERCGWRCYGPGEDECCHVNCAVGCTGPGPQDCMVCMDYMLEPEKDETLDEDEDNRPSCVGYCPDKTYPKLQTCVRF